MVTLEHEYWDEPLRVEEVVRALEQMDEADLRVVRSWLRGDASQRRAAKEAEKRASQQERTRLKYERNERALRMSESGSSVKEIAAELGLAQSYIPSILGIARTQRLRRRVQSDGECRRWEQDVPTMPGDVCEFCGERATRRISNRPVCYRHIGDVLTEKRHAPQPSGGAE